MSKNNFGYILAFAAGVVISFLLIDNILKKKKIQELQNSIDENEDLNNEIRNILTDLIQNNEEVDPKVSNELAQIVALLEIHQDTTAVFKLAKIVESLLRELYHNDPELYLVAEKNGHKKPSFADFLELSRNKKTINEEDYHLLIVLKNIRNSEAHELSVYKEKSRIIAAFLTGLGLILKLCKLLKKKTIVSTTTTKIGL